MVSGQHNLGTFLIHVLTVYVLRSRINSYHIVVGTVNGQLQLIGVHLLEVGSQGLVGVNCVLELSLSRNFLASSVRPVYKVVAEVLGSCQCYLAASLVLISLRVCTYATSFLRRGGNSQRVHVNGSLGTIYLTIDANVSETTIFRISQTCSSVEVEAFARGKSSLLIFC